MLDSYIDMLKKSLDLKSRTDRTTYWTGILIWLIILAILLWFADKVKALSILPKIFAIAMIIPTLSATFRRLNDTAHSKWWMLLMLIPVIGWFGIFVYCIGNSASDEEIAELKNRRSSGPRLF